MHSAFVGAICRIGIFIVCAQVLVHFRPDVSYEKYLKMLVSIMILLQILQPVAALLNGEQGRNLQERVAWFEKQLSDSMDAADQSRDRAERLRERMSLEEVQRRLQEEAERLAGEEEEERRSTEEAEKEREPAEEMKKERRSAEEAEKERQSAEKTEKTEAGEEISDGTGKRFEIEPVGEIEKTRIVIGDGREDDPRK